MRHHNHAHFTPAPPERTDYRAPVITQGKLTQSELATVIAAPDWSVELRKIIRAKHN